MSMGQARPNTSPPRAVRTFGASRSARPSADGRQAQPRRDRAGVRQQAFAEDRGPGAGGGEQRGEAEHHGARPGKYAHRGDQHAVHRRVIGRIIGLADRVHDRGSDAEVGERDQRPDADQ
jgi:hypothetical protein